MTRSWALILSRAMTEVSKPTVMQALGDKRMTAVLLVSFASGFPFNLTGFTLQAWLASAGLDIKTIGIFGLVGFPYILKFFWGPLSGLFFPPFFGERALAARAHTFGYRPAAMLGGAVLVLIAAELEPLVGPGRGWRFAFLMV